MVMVEFIAGDWPMEEFESSKKRAADPKIRRPVSSNPVGID
jgi:hypothetical protein